MITDEEKKEMEALRKEAENAADYADIPRAMRDYVKDKGVKETLMYIVKPGLSNICEGEPEAFGKECTPPKGIDEFCDHETVGIMAITAILGLVVTALLYFAMRLLIGQYSLIFLIIVAPVGIRLKQMADIDEKDVHCWKAHVIGEHTVEFENGYRKHLPLDGKTGDIYVVSKDMKIFEVISK